MTEPVTASEKFTFFLCQQTFLSPWSFNNPLGKKGKELCDVLVVCDPDVILFSVKDIALGDADDPVSHKRWEKKAVDASVSQLYGASKWVTNATHVIRADGSQAIPFPSFDSRKLHRIAVAFGSDDQCITSSGNFGKGHVHVLTETSLRGLMQELDTVSEFVDYLTAKEQFLTNQGSIIINGSEMDLLALYIHGGREFPPSADFLVIEEGLWAEVSSKPEFVARKKADEVSYKWDDLIEILSREDNHDRSDHGLDRSDRERVVRGMAKENRFYRRVLAEGLVGFLRDAKDGKTRSRIAQSPSGCIYVFVYFRSDEERPLRMHELYARCLIARSKIDQASIAVVGIGFNEFDPNIGTAIDLLYMEINENNDDWRAEALELESEWGYFKNRPVLRTPVDEFPTQ